MPTILSSHSILFIHDISRGLDNTKTFLYKLSVWQLVVKPAWVKWHYSTVRLKLIMSNY